MPLHRTRQSADWRLIGLVASVAAILIASFVKARPDLVFTSAFLFQDQGNHVLVAERLAQGAVLYRDVAYPYGPLPALLGGAVAFSFGISALTYVVLQALLNAAFLVLLAHVLAGHVPRHTAAAIVLLGVLPLSMAPSATAGGAASNTYIGLERLVLVVLVASWTPPEERTVATSAVAGLTLGVWQLVKAGGAAMALAAWLVVDVLAACGGGSAAWRRLARGWATIAVVLLAFEACRWATLFATLPAPIALDAAWPWYTLEHYRSIPEAVSGRELGAVELSTHAAVPATALGLTLLGVRTQVADVFGRRALGLLIPAVFFALGFAGYFGHREILWQYAWAAIPGAAFALSRAGRTVKSGTALVAVPALVLLLSTMAGVVRGRATEPMRMPNGDTLWMNSPARAAAIEAMALLRETGNSAGPARTLVLPSGGGLYFYTGAVLPTRHVWVIERHVRPHEFDRIRGQMLATDRIVLLNEPGITAERFDERVRAILGPATADLWKGRVSWIGHRVGWSLVGIQPASPVTRGPGPADPLAPCV